MISIIVSISQNYAIGKDNKLLWHISEDLKRFKRLTNEHAVVMGKKTYDSLPRKPLPNRRNIIISDVDEKIEGCEISHSIEETLLMLNPNYENFIIGGASVYKQFMKFADKLYITWVYENFDADVFFPEIDNNWIITEKENHFDEESQLNYSFYTYLKK